MLIESFLDYLQYERNYSEKTVLAYGVPTDVYQQFMFELFGTSVYARQRMRVVRSEYSGEWNISNKSMDGGNIKAVTTYGTKRITAYHILEQTLNQRVVKVFDTVVEDGKERPVLNVKETAIAQDRHIKSILKLTM